MILQRCEIIDRDNQLENVVYVRVPGIYPKGNALPLRMAQLIKPAAEALDAAMIEIVADGGHLHVSDMFRSAQDQARAHHDYLTGRKSAYSPPPGGSMHQAARSIDIDPSDTGIGLAAVKKILAAHGWTGIADRGSECWHHDWRGEDGQAAYDADEPGGMSAYRTMARYCIEAIGNTLSLHHEAKDNKKIRDIQKLLNEILSLSLVVDGIYGNETREAVRIFQATHALIVDGIVGPDTSSAIRLARGGY
jgi:murein L,D-transpeptidase YcbB/YkuD